MFVVYCHQQPWIIYEILVLYLSADFLLCWSFNKAGYPWLFHFVILGTGNIHKKHQGINLRRAAGAHL